MLGCSSWATASASARKRAAASAVGVGAGQDHLQGDGAVEPDLAGPVDHAHAAAAQLAQDLVARDDRGRTPGTLRRQDIGPGRCVWIGRVAVLRGGGTVRPRRRAIEVMAGHDDVGRVGYPAHRIGGRSSGHRSPAWRGAGGPQGALHRVQPCRPSTVLLGCARVDG